MHLTRPQDKKCSWVDGIQRLWMQKGVFLLLFVFCFVGACSISELSFF